MRAPVLALAAVAILGACGLDERAIDISASPNRQYHRTGTSVELTGTITNAAGLPITGEGVDWLVEPEGAVIFSGDSAVETASLVLEGRVVVTGCVAGRTDACDSVALQIDDGSPVLEIESPRPGGESDGADGIEVIGSVSDSGALRVFAAGETVAVDELGRFSVVVPAQFGANHIAVTASDGLTEESTVEMDVLWAPAFLDAAGDDDTPQLTLARGIAVSLGQALFDDRQPLDTQATPIVAGDLADVLTLVAERLSLVDQIPDPVIDDPSFTLRIPAADPGPATSSVDVSASGVQLSLRLPELRLTTEGSLEVAGATLDLAGGVVASVAAAAQVEVRRDSEAAPLEVELTSLLIALETVTGEFDDPEANAIFLLAEGVLRTTIEEQLLGGVSEALETSLPAILRDVFDGLDNALADRELVLDDPLLSAPLTLQLDGRVDRVAPTGGVDLVAELRTTVGTTSPIAFPESRGVALLDPTGAGPAFFRDRDLQVGVRLAFLNGLLHALWNSGALDIDLTSLVEDEVGGLITAGRISAKMPPVLRPPRVGETDRLVLSFGQVEVDLELEGGEQVRFGVGLDSAIDVAIEDSALVVFAPGDPRIRVWTIVAAENSVVSEELVATVLGLQWPDLRDSILGGLRLDLPVPGLGSLGTLAPDLADFALAFELVEPASLRGGSVYLHAQLRGEL